MKPRPLLLVLLLTGAVTAGCSSAGTSNSVGGSGTTPPASRTVSLSTYDVLGVGTVVEAGGRAVYYNDQDSTIRILCGAGCAGVWTPVTVTSVPPSIGGISFSTVVRSDGTEQLAEQGHPLYTFVRDKARADANGRGATDAFGGQPFSWHPLTTVGSTPGTTQAPPPTGGAGGY
ncbi:hypothetical protein DN069_28285 [Streptacidiphilus pinicola]|uniref:Lipoprotein n=1 Tax=Streptacidiphilus pinicola TaxID=2219663 RepID=A0A2X0IBL9_9ACTN|nr:hypothetical protein [Streptacidiphilus pinicola]RAG82334.1 hypothetical protein DN069_28285 [Streptacidiphilus pinicola]